MLYDIDKNSCPIYDISIKIVVLYTCMIYINKKCNCV